MRSERANELHVFRGGAQRFTPEMGIEAERKNKNLLEGRRCNLAQPAAEFGIAHFLEIPHALDEPPYRPGVTPQCALPVLRQDKKDKSNDHGNAECGPENLHSTCLQNFSERSLPLRNSCGILLPNLCLPYGELVGVPRDLAWHLDGHE